MLVGSSKRPIKWSDVFLETSKALSAETLDLRSVDRLLLEDNVEYLANPLFAPPPLTDSTDTNQEPEPANEEVVTFHSHISELYFGKKEDLPQAADALRPFATQALKSCSEENEKELIEYLLSFHGARLNLSFAKSNRSSQALSLLFLERRALLLTLKLIFFDQKLLLVRKKLLEKNVISNICERVLELSDRLNQLLSTTGQREALRAPLQVASLIWERHTLLSISFMAATAHTLSQSDFSGMAKVCRELSRDRSAGLGTETLSIISHSSYAIMSGHAAERVSEWNALERSHVIDAIMFTVFGCIAQLQQSDSFVHSGAVLQFSDLVGEGWLHDGVLGLLELAWCFCRPTLGDDADLLGWAFAHRALAFLRCLMRCSEFRGQSEITRNRMVTVIRLLVDEIIKWVSEVNRDPGMSGMDDVDNGGFDEDYGSYLVSKDDERSRSANTDSLEDLLECIMHIAKVQQDPDYVAQFFIESNGAFYNFLRHCSNAAEKRTYYNLISNLASAGGSGHMFDLCSSFLSREFVERIVARVHDFREGLVPDSSVDEICSHLKALRTLFEIANSDGKESMARAISNNSSNFITSCLVLIAHPAILNENLKTALLRSLAVFASAPETSLAVEIAEKWTRHFVFPYSTDATNPAEPRLDLRAHLNRIESPNHIYAFSTSFLELSTSLVKMKTVDQMYAVHVAHFVIEDILIGDHHRQYSHPGEKWLVYSRCLEVLLQAVSTVEASPGPVTHAGYPNAGFHVMGLLLQESLPFSCLIEILRSAGNGKGAKGLEDHVVVSKRWPFDGNVSSRTVTNRPEWLLAGKKRENLDVAASLQLQTTRPPAAVSLGPLLHSSITDFQSKERNLALGQQNTKTDTVAVKLVREWLLMSDPAPVQEHPYLWDDGDPACQHRLECVRLVLELLVRLIKAQEVFISWSRSQPAGSIPLRVHTLILSRPHIIVEIIAGYIGFSLDESCRALALTILDNVANACENPNQEVFAWTKAKNFFYCLDQHASDEERERMFDFLYRHRPLNILRESVGPLVDVLNASAEDTKSFTDAIRTLSLVAHEERQRSGLAVVPYDLPEKLICRYFSYANNQSTLFPAEILSGLSWTLRLLSNVGSNPAFLFARPAHVQNTIFENLLSLFLNGMASSPEHAAHFIQSWRSILEANLTRVDDPLALAIALLDGVIGARQPTSNTMINLSKATLSLLQVLFSTSKLQEDALLSSREELFAIISRCAEASMLLSSTRNHEAFAYSLAALLKAIISLKKARKSPLNVAESLNDRGLLSSEDIQGDFDRVSISAMTDALTANSRAEVLMNACASICMDRNSPQLLRSICASAFAELIRFCSRPNQYLDISSRKGIFQGIIASSVDPIFEPPPKDGVSFGWLEKRFDDASVEPVLAALEQVAKKKEGASILADSLTALWRQQGFLILDKSAPAVRYVLDQNRELARKRSETIIPLLRLVLAVSTNEVRFGLRFLRCQRLAVISSLSSQRDEREVEEAYLYAAILAACARFNEQFSYEFDANSAADGATGTAFTAGVVSALCACVSRLKNNNGFPTYLSQVHDRGLIQSCLVYLTQRLDAGILKQELPASSEPMGGRRREEISALVTLAPVLASFEGQTRKDLERCLLLLLDRMSKGWHAKEDMKDLKILFPQQVGGASSPSLLERIADSEQNSGGFINILCSRLYDLRFR